MLKPEKVWFQHNRMHVKLNDGRTELRHLLNWPNLFAIKREELAENKVTHSTIFWPKLKFELKLEDFLKAEKR